MKWILFGGILLFLGGCAAQQSGIEKGLKLWEGRQTSELFEKWGYPPDELTREGDKMIYSYRRSAGASAVSIRGSVSGYAAQCVISFETKNEIILAVRFEGDESCSENYPRP